MRRRCIGLSTLTTLLLAGTAIGTPAQPERWDPEHPPPEADQPADQPAAVPAEDAAQPADDLDQPVEITEFAEPIDINDFVDIVAAVLEINVTKDAGLSGQIAFNAGVEVTKRQLLPLLDARLEELGYTIVPDTTGFYTIRRADQLAVIPGGTTRFIPTPGVLPSALAPAVQTHLGLGAGQGTGAGGRISYDDELGVIVVTAPPRVIEQLELFVGALIEQRQSLVIEVIPLRYISAPVALERAAELLDAQQGESLLPAAVQARNEQPVVRPIGGSGAGLTSLTRRLTVDPAGNALIFRGPADELDEIRAVVERVDRSNRLVSERYFTGSATRRIADLAERQGFGEVIEATDDLSLGAVNQLQQQFNREFITGGSGSGSSGGSQLIVDRLEGYITYFATPEQQAAFAELISGFETEDEVVVVTPYKLEYSDAEDVASILQALIDRSRPQEESNAFLPRGQQGAAPILNQLNPEAPMTLAEGETSIAAGESFVIADSANNQVIVQAPRSQQEQFQRLIRQIDLRRAQVYIEATIISVSDTDDFRLAIEGAFNDIDANGNGGGIQSNFGLSTAGATFTDPRVIATGLGGMTAALIRSDFVPIIVNATKSDTSSRVVATPQLLVDDNANAIVLQTQEVPFQTTNRSDVGDLISFEFATAQTSLDVTPQISAGGTIRLDYTINLENFTGPSAGGAPPPKQTNQVEGESVTVPNGGTVVIGGLGLKSNSETIVKIPLIGDIPVVGNLFRDTNRDSSDTVLYVFLTPRVLRDPDMMDYRLLTMGPASQVDLPDYIPELEPVMIESTFLLPDERGGGLVLPSDRDPNLDQQRLRPGGGD